MDKMQFCNNAVITMLKNELKYKKHVRSLKANSIELVLPEKVTGSELVKKFPAFYGIRRFIAAITSARHLVPVLSQISPFLVIPLLDDPY